MKNKNKHSFMIGVVALLGIFGQTVVVSTASAAPAVDQVTTGAMAEKKHIAAVETSGVNTVLDIPLRVGGFVATIVGTGLFIGTSPITGLMTAIYPHNAIEQAADFFVVRPGRYTFVRPTGDFNYDSRPDEEK